MSTASSPSSHRWRFFRSGGFDQVRLETADDLRNLATLDQKLWSVLGCPTVGLEFDSRTLAMIDSDGDGQIRSPELIAAVRWACAVFKDPAILFKEGDVLALADIDAASTEGAQVLRSARQVLSDLGKPDGDAIALADLADPATLFAPNHFNGDGIVPAELAPDAPLAETITLIAATLGADTDRSGQPGVGSAKCDAFFTQADAYLAWQAQAGANPADILPLGDATAAAAGLFDGLQAKVDDFFTRCRLAAFDPQATGALNPVDAQYAALSAQSINATASEVAALPLARVAADAALPLARGLNPAWADQIAAFRSTVVVPLLGECDALGFDEWQGLSARFGAYRTWLAAKPDTPVVAIDPAVLARIAADDTRVQLAALIAQDLQAAEAALHIDSVERALHYRRDLVTLLNNFVSFTDFYSRRKKAIFQAGTLYLDQRSCDLCLRVANMDKHAALAPFSGTYLVYCNCTRKDEAPITIVAALTGGDADELMAPGRNGVFYDRAGRDWNATVVKVVDNPISVRQAFWSPYKRIGRMIGDQIQKFAAAREKAVDEKAAAGVASTATKAEAPAAAPAAPPAPFDIAKFAGIFAAIGLALGALGTALAAIITGFLALPVWQMPLVVAGIVLLISGPSMLLAWLKLRQRNLGPLLDANGWAVNTRARINIPFGGALTGLATLPAGASRSLDDPYAEKRTPWKRYVFLLIIVAVLAALWQNGVLQAWINPQAAAPAAAPEAAPPAPPAPPAAKPAG